ncbi:MAG: hypothetical protein AAGF12_02810 [Myxococcota bacterium]
MKRILTAAVAVWLGLGCGDDDDATDAAAETDSGEDADAADALFPPGTNAEEIVVTSADGRLTIRIPPGSTQWAVNDDDVTVLALDDVGGAVQGATVVDAYSLGPDGLRFDPPATLEWTVDEPSDPRFQMFLLTSELGAESFAVETFNASDTSFVVELPIPHFSDVWNLRVDLASAETLNVVDTAPLGGQLSFSERVSFGEPSADLMIEPPGASPFTYFFNWENITSEAGWSLSHSVTTRRFDDSVVTPSSQFEQAGPDAATFLDVSHVWTCAGDGDEGISAYRTVDFMCRVRLVRDDGFVQMESMRTCRAGRNSERLFGARCLAPSPDEIGAFLDSIAAAIATFTSTVIDIVSSAASELTLTQQDADALFNNSAFECGDTGAESGQRVICGSAPPTLQAGNLLRATLNLADDAPTGDAEQSYIYSLVLDSDGDPANNWEFVPPFDWDLFQGTDRWYQLIWDHPTQAWSLTATQVMPDQTTQTVPTGAWATIVGSHINFYVPEAEYDPAEVTYRLTAFGHDGSFSPTDRGADVTGADPTEPPIRPTR